MNMPQIGPWQKKDKQLLPRVQHVMLHAMGCPSACTVTKGLVALSFDVMQISDSAHVQKFTRTLFRFYKDLEKTIPTMSKSEFETVYDAFDEFINKYPKSHPAFGKAGKLDILRCHVTLVKSLVRANRDIALEILGRSYPLNNIYSYVSS